MSFGHCYLHSSEVILSLSLVYSSHVCTDQYSAEYLQSNFCRSLEFSCFVAVFFMGLCPINHLILVNSDSSGLSWSNTTQTGNSVKAVNQGNCRAHLTCIPSLRGHCSSQCVQYLKLFCIFCVFSGCFRWELLVSCLRPRIRVTFNRLILNRTKHIDYLESQKKTFLHNGSPFFSHL